MLVVGNTYKVNIIGLDYKGDGIAMINDSYIYIPGALENEEVETRIYRYRKNIGFGSLTKVITKSKDRVRDTSELGSLNLSHLSFEKQLQWQADVTKETFEKVLKEELNVKQIVTDNVVSNYRNKVTYHLLNSPVIKLGLYKQNSKDLVEVNNFDLANEFANEVLSLINSSNIKVDTKRLQHVMIKNNKDNELLVTLIAFNRSFLGKEELIELISSNENVKGITLNIKESEEVILGSRSYLLYGSNELKQDKLLITDQSFMQVNYGVMDLTYEIIKSYIKGKRVIDAYSGIGSIVYSILDNTYKPVLIESNLANIKLAEKIKENNNFTNVEIIHDVAENAIDKLKADTLIVDPPRVGLKDTFVNEVIRQTPSRVIYLSCNLQTLIRDVRLMSEKYSILAIYPIKMFPQTNSFETLAILDKK